MLLKYFKIRYILILLFASTLTGCFRYMGLCVDIFSDSCKLEIVFMPDDLPNATLGKPYSALIKMSGGAIPGKKDVQVTFFPENSGLSMRSANNDGSYNEIELYGIPKISGKIEVYIEGVAYKYRGFGFEKNYVIEVNP